LSSKACKVKIAGFFKKKMQGNLFKRYDKINNSVHYFEDCNLSSLRAFKLTLFVVHSLLLISKIPLPMVLKKWQQ